MVDEGCQSEGVGGSRVGGGLEVSGLFTGARAAGDQPGTAAAGVGVVEGGVETVDEVRADLFAQAVRDDGAGNKVLGGPTFLGRRSMAPSGWRW